MTSESIIKGGTGLVCVKDKDGGWYEEDVVVGMGGVWGILFRHCL